MCQALLSIKIEPAGDDELKLAAMRLHAAVTNWLLDPKNRSNRAIELAARIVSAPRIRARVRGAPRDAISAAIRQVDELLSKYRDEGEQWLMARIWRTLNEPEINVVLARSVRSANPSS